MSVGVNSIMVVVDPLFSWRSNEDFAILGGEGENLENNGGLLDCMYILKYCDLCPIRRHSSN